MLSWNNPRAPLAPSTAPFPQAPQLDSKSHLRAGNKTKPGAKPTASPNDYFSARSNPILLTPWQIQTGAGKHRASNVQLMGCLMILIIALASNLWKIQQQVLKLGIQLRIWWDIGDRKGRGRESEVMQQRQVEESSSCYFKNCLLFLRQF